MISRVERKKQEARERILAAAQKLFVVDQRYERVTIREVADLADVSVGAVYLHFRTKGEILAELLSIQMRRLTGLVFNRVAEKRTGREKLEVLLASVNEVRRDPSLAIFALIPFLARSGGLDERVDILINSQLEGMIATLTEVFRVGSADGTLRVAGDPALQACVFNRTLTAVLGGMLFAPSGLERVGSRGNLGDFQEDEIFVGFLDLLRSAFFAAGERERTEISP